MSHSKYIIELSNRIISYADFFERRDTKNEKKEIHLKKALLSLLMALTLTLSMTVAYAEIPNNNGQSSHDGGQPSYDNGQSSHENGQ